MKFAIYVTEQITNSYEFDTEAEAREAMESGDYWQMEAQAVDGEVLDVEIVELSGH